MLFESKKPIKSETIYGHLAVLKLCQIAGYDAHLGDAAKRVFTMIAGHSGTDERCYCSLSKIAKRNGLSRAAILKQVKILEKHGYLSRTARYHKDGGRAVSIITFNGDLARQYSSTPDIFCKANVTLIVTYLVTLLRYRDCYPNKIRGHETLESYINKTDPIKQIKENKLNKTHALLTKRKTLHASAWEEQKKRQAETGITNEMNSQLKDLSDELREHLGSARYVDFTLTVQREAKGMSIKAGTQHCIDRYQEKLKELCEGVCDAEEQQASGA